jgi:hypothetical protein
MEVRRSGRRRPINSLPLPPFFWKGGVAIEYRPDGLMQFMVKSTLETSKALETLKAEYLEGVRRRSYEATSRIYAGIAERL